MNIYLLRHLTDALNFDVLISLLPSSPQCSIISVGVISSSRIVSIKLGVRRRAQLYQVTRCDDILTSTAHTTSHILHPLSHISHSPFHTFYTPRFTHFTLPVSHILHSPFHTFCTPHITHFALPVSHILHSPYHTFCTPPISGSKCHHNVPIFIYHHHPHTVLPPMY